MSGWMPIETCPVDSEGDVLLLAHNRVWQGAAITDREGVRIYVETWEHTALSPSHWMPIPTPPEDPAP